MPLHGRFFRALVMALACSISACSYLPFGKKPEAAQAPEQRRPTIAVIVNGIEGPPAKNVEGHVTIGRRGCNTPRAYLESLAEQAQNEALEALRAYGYYHATVRVSIEQSDDCPTAQINVEPGARVTIDAIDIVLDGEASSDTGFAKALAAAPLSVGQPLNHSDYAATKALIESTALERGYLEGRFAHSALRVEPAANTAAVNLTFAAGRRFTLGEIGIAQNPPFIDEALVRQFLDYTPSEPYHAGTVTRFYRALASNEYFADVEVRPLLSAPEGGTIPVEISLTPRPKHKFGAGIGASTDELIRAKLNYANRRLNRYGHRFSAEARGSAIEQSLTSRYQIPREHPSDEWLSVQAGLRREEVDSFKTVETQVGLSETKRRPWEIMETRFLNLNRQQFDVGASDQETSTLLIPGMNWKKVTTNDALYPTRGYSATLEIRGAADALLSDTSFTRMSISAQTVRGLPRATRLLVRTSLGALWVDKFDELPPSERFFAGGDTSIRGYDIDALGPVDEAGEVIGGNYLGVLSLELEKTIVGNWGVAGFVDAGNAFGGDGSSTGIKTGVGIGLRWRSPVGPVRIDLAHPLDADNAVRLHLRIGPDL